MIRKLKIRFVSIAMVAVSAVLLVVLATINIFFWQHAVGQADDLLAYLAENNGDFASADIPPERPESASRIRPESAPESRNEGSRYPLPREFRMNKEISFRTRCFSVLFDVNGDISQVRTDRIAAISDDDAKLMAQEVLDSRKNHGFSGIYRFYAERREDGTFIGFLDCNDDLHSFRVLLAISIAILLFCLAAVFILVLIFSNRAILPVVASMERQKRFIADAGHELKTPITIIGANAAVLAMTGCDNEWTQSIRNQTQRLDGLVRELLTLSRVETDSALPMESFNLSEAASETVTAFETLIRSMNRSFSISIPDSIFFCGSEEHIRRLISIFLDNAAKYTPEGGEVSFSIEKLPRCIRIETQNSCLPIENQHLEHLFERFYRADAARSRETGGYGIGLSIAREIIEKHHGKVNVHCPDAGRIVFSVTLPL